MFIEYMNVFVSKRKAFEISLVGIKDVIHYNLAIMYLQFFLLQITSFCSKKKKKRTEKTVEYNFVIYLKFFLLQVTTSPLNIKY